MEGANYFQVRNCVPEQRSKVFIEKQKKSSNKQCVNHSNKLTGIQKKQKHKTHNEEKNQSIGNDSKLT